MKGLSEGQIERIRRATEDILENTGIRVRHEGILRSAGKTGAKVEETSGIVKIPAPMLRELLSHIPKQYTVAGMNGESKTVGSKEPHGLAIVTDPWIIDYETRQPRKPRLEDIRRHTRVAQKLDQVVAISLMDYPVTDFKGPDSSLHALEAHLLNHDKHMYVLATSLESFERWLRIGRMLARGHALKGSRLMTIGVAMLSPLTLTEMNAQFLLSACEHDFPVVPTICPMAGTTSPYSKAGTLLLGHAENVFLGALTQMIRPGHPFLYALGPSRTDMRTGEDMYYTLDKVLWKTASVQLGKAYGMPTAAECGGTMTCRYDPQNGAEGILFMLSAYQSGADMLAGIGSCCNAVGMSGEMMVIHTAWLEAAKFLCAGIDIEAHLGLENIKRAGPGGHYMEDEMTLELLRSDEFFFNELFDYGSCREGQPSMLERAHRKVEEMTTDFRSPVPEEVQEELRRFFRDLKTPERKST